MELQVLKRDGRKEPFNFEKIGKAIKSAWATVPGDLTFEDLEKKIFNYIYKKIFARSKFSREISVEQIQDIVENCLMKYNREVARAYIRYRYKHEMIRDRYQDLMDGITTKIMAKDVQNQNANVDENSFGGRVGEMSDYVLKQYALENCMSEMARNNHLNNEIYVHDLSHYAIGDHNCLSLPIDDLLKNGFTTRQVDIRPANSVNTAFQLLAVLFQIQSLCQFGGVSATHLDWSMVPYVRKSFSKHFKDGIKYCLNNEEYSQNVPKELAFDDPEANDIRNKSAYRYAMEMTEKEVYQAAEGMLHNLNSLQSRSGNQLPFSSINLGTCTLPEGRLVIKAVLENLIKGVGKLHKTSIFPCTIFQCMRGVNRKEGDPNYDLFLLALKSTSLRLYPNYANCDWSGNEGYDKNDPRTYFSTIKLVAQFCEKL